MARSLSNIVNLAEGTHKIKYEYKYDDKICEICEIKYKDWDYFLQYTNFKGDLIDYKCLCCKKNLKKRFFNRYKFSINKFILMLWIGVQPYEYMDDWEKFNEISLPEKEDLYIHLNMEDISYADYTHAIRVCKNFQIKKYHDLHIQSNKFLLADVFENFQNMYLEIFELDPAGFLTAPGLAWQAALKKTKVKLDLLTDLGMLLMVEKGIREGICQAVDWYAKTAKKYRKDHDKDKQSPCGKYWDVNNFFDSSLPLPPASQTLRHYPGNYCKELTSTHRSQVNWNRESLVSEHKSLTTKLCPLIWISSVSKVYFR